MFSIIQSIKARLSITSIDEDSWLTDMVNSAFVKVSSKIFGDYETVEDLPLKYQEVVKNAVMIAYNQQGAEGQSSVSSDSITQAFDQTDMYDYIDKHMPNRPVV